MDVNTISTLITTLGFPIVCVIGLGWFVYKIYQDTTKANETNMEKVQARCKEREEKLYNEIKENREVNAQAIATIALYADRLEVIQNDVSEIKTDIAVLMSK
jgi:hypothetical protein